MNHMLYALRHAYAQVQKADRAIANAEPLSRLEKGAGPLKAAINLRGLCI